MTENDELIELCKELVDDLDAWLDCDGQPSSYLLEFTYSITLVKRARSILKNNA
jgi:hypothetical protein